MRLNLKFGKRRLWSALTGKWDQLKKSFVYYVVLLCAVILILALANDCAYNQKMRQEEATLLKDGAPQGQAEMPDSRMPRVDSVCLRCRPHGAVHEDSLKK